MLPKISTGPNPELKILPNIVYTGTIRNGDIIYPECIDLKPTCTARRCFNPLKVICFTLGYLTLLMNVFNSMMIIFFLIISDIAERELDQIENSLEKGVKIEQSIGFYLLLIIVTLLLLNGIWMVWNICILVRLHQKRPGRIYLHVITKIFRVLLLLIISVGPNNFTVFTATIITEIGFTIFFTLFYYLHATKLAEMHNREILINETSVSPATVHNENYFSYPKTLYKMRLVDHNESY